MNLEFRCRQVINELGLASPEESIVVKPLTGGVSSDIASVAFNQKKICVKFALEKLKVSADWYAPIQRNEAEYRWLEFAHSITPESTPRLLGRSVTHNAFAMEFIEGEDSYLWKTSLLNEEADQGEAGKIGSILGRIHAASAGTAMLENDFQNQQDFTALRLEPYLQFTASRYPDLSDDLHGLVSMLEHHEYVLVHGDVSPKNVVFRSNNPILLDAECATIGDPCFDVAFCINHLLLKATHLPSSRKSLLASVEKFWSAYEKNISWEKSNALEQRVCRLLPALMLARIDGKSPVEYLDEKNRELVRSIAKPLITKPAQSLFETIDTINKNLEK